MARLPLTAVRLVDAMVLFRNITLKGLSRAFSEHYLDATEFEVALDYCRRALVEDPSAEKAHRLAMQIYGAQGDRPAVARQFEQCKRELQDRVDVEPSPQTQALYETLMN